MTSTQGGAAPEQPAAFYLPDGPGRYRTTGAAQGPWDPAMQHGGPPAALLASAIEEHAGREGLRTARVTVDFLGPVPLGTLDVTVEVLRPGRRVQLAEARLTHEGRVVAVARTWQHAVGGTADTVPTAGDPVPALPAPQDHGAGMLGRFGYGRAHDWRMTAGSMDAPGPGAAWARPLVPLVAGTRMTGLQRALVVADSANGASLALPVEKMLSMPTSLTVAFLRHPAGEWVHLDARTDLSGDGIGLSSARLSDPAGLFATVTQPLLVAGRT